MRITLLPVIAGMLATCPAMAKDRPASAALQAVQTATQSATVEPGAAGFVSGAQVYPFSEGTIFQAYAAPGLVTDIALQPGENLIAVASGDTARWIIGDTTSGTGEAARPMCW